jgi:PST family polysaccharide transporter
MRPAGAAAARGGRLRRRLVSGIPDDPPADRVMDAAAGANPAGERTVTRQRVFSSVVWTAAQSWGTQLISLATFLLLARLLPPTAFGLVAMAGLYVTISTILVDQGLSAAVIQREDLEPEHLDTAFWMSVAVGLCLTAAGVLLARPLAALFKEPRLAPVVALLSFNFVLASLSGVQDALLRRNFRFRLLAVRTLLAGAGGGVVAVGMAVAGWGVMSLVAQQLATSVLGVATLWAASGWRPGLRVSGRHARELWGFGVSVVGTRLLGAVTRRSDDFLIGLFLGAGALGYYTVAYKIFSILGEVFTKIISRVALPAFAAMQNRGAELAAAFGNAVRLTSLLTLPSFAALGVLAPAVVPALFGPRWAPSVPVMQMLTVAGALQCLYPLSIQAMVARGKPSWTFWVLLAGTVPSVVGFLLVVDRGIAAVAAVYSLVNLLLLPLHLHILRRLIGFRPADLLRAVRTPLLATAAMLAVLAALRFGTAPLLASRAAVGAALFVAAATYALAVHLLDPRLLGGLRAALKGRGGRGKRGAAAVPPLAASAPGRPE